MKENNINKIIAYNLKKIRIENNLSLDDVANFTGVSKSMINKIETLNSTPTVTVLWKIANGLKISFSTFMEKDVEYPQLLERNKIVPIVEKNYRVYTYIPYVNSNNMEMFYIELDPYSKYTSRGHDKSTYEYVYSLRNNLEIKLEENKSTLVISENMFKFDA